MTEFEKATKRMREAQKRFRRTADPAQLPKIRMLEAQIDRMLDELENGPELFSREGSEHDEP